MTNKFDDVDKYELHLKCLFEYGVNISERVINLNGDVTEAMFKDMDIQLTEMESQSKKAVTVRINSSGGNVYDGLAIAGRLRFSKCQIITQVFGQAMSAACLIFAAGNRRQASKFAFVMHHEISGGVDGRLSEMKTELEHMNSIERFWAAWMAEFTKKNRKFWLEEGRYTDAYWDASALVELGVADEVI